MRGVRVATYVRAGVSRSDVALAGATAALVTASTLSGNYTEGGDRSVYLVTGLLETLSLTWRRRAPFWVLGFNLTVGLTEGIFFVPGDGLGIFFGILVPVYTAAAVFPVRKAAWALVLPIPVELVSEWQVSGHVADDFTFFLGLLGATWAVGRVVWSRQRLLDEVAAQARTLAAQTEELRHTQEVEVRAARAEERAAIARDVHDAIAHSVTVMVVHAEAAEAVLPQDPHGVEESLHAIQDTGRGALADLRGVLDVLNGDDTSSQLAPGCGMAALPELTSQLAAAGLDVAVQTSGTPTGMSALVDQTSYRIVQEALTNALRHGADHTARLSLGFGPDRVRIEVENPVPRPNGRPHRIAGSGRGLEGIRQRVEALGGTFEAKVCDEIFRVRVELDARTGTA